MSLLAFLLKLSLLWPLGLQLELLESLQQNDNSWNCWIQLESLQIVYGQDHWILHCETLFDALDYFPPLISELEQAEVDKKELVFGVQDKSNREMLRNIIKFSIRYISIHKSRGTAFNNPNSAKAMVINMAKHKIRN